MIAASLSQRTIALWLTLWVPGAVSCSSPHEAPSKPLEEAVRNEGPMLPEIHCAASPTQDRRIVVHYEIRNVSAESIHIVDNHRVPYQIARDLNTLVILHGINRPEPTVLYEMEVPLTRPLLPGEVVTGELMWPTTGMRDHYRGRVTPANLLHGTIQVRCEVGWWVKPITEADSVSKSLLELLASQHVVGYGPFDVTLP